MDEAKKRDYKAEYKKFQSSTKMKKYRAELNKYNRQKGTYGNGDKKDASHKGGKIVGFENQSKNRGRAEKSRLKKENKIVESIWNYIKEGDELQRWKVYIKGEKKPLILTGKDKNSVKKFAHQMIHNNKVKIVKVVKEGILKESFQKRHFLNLIKQEIDSLKGQIAYSNDKVNYKGTPDWEKKEFKAVLKDLKKKLKDTEKHYKRVEKLKEGLELTEAGSLSGPVNFGTDLGAPSYIHPDRKEDVKNQGVYLQGFSNKEARQIIDGNLKKWVSSLRKVEHQVIKDWMNGAKRGQIDFFDIIRGLKTGDIRRAHPFEVDFLTKILNRNKIIDRFRSYFKGKKGKPGRTK